MKDRYIGLISVDLLQLLRLGSKDSITQWLKTLIYMTQNRIIWWVLMKFFFYTLCKRQSNSINLIVSLTELCHLIHTILVPSLFSSLYSPTLIFFPHIILCASFHCWILGVLNKLLIYNLRQTTWTSIFIVTFNVVSLNSTMWSIGFFTVTKHTNLLTIAAYHET